MKIRQAKKIIKEGTLDGHHNDYWGTHWLAFLASECFMFRNCNGDHRIRKAITVYEKRNRHFLRKN